MHDVQIVEAIAQVLYPFIALLAWWNVHKHNVQMKKKLEGTDHKMNGILAELVATKEALAYERGKKDGIAQTINARLALERGER